MKIIENAYKKLAEFQKKYTYPIFGIILLLAVIMLVGASKIEMQSDMNKEMPQQLPIYQLNNKITDKFGGQDTIFIVLELEDDMAAKTDINDIRSPEVIDYLIDIENSLIKESIVQEIMSVGSIMKNIPYSNLESIIKITNSNPSFSQFFSKNYKVTIMTVSIDIGSSEEKIVAATDLIQEKLNSITKPAGVKVSVTGNPPMRVLILNLLFSDATYTIMLASLAILLLLIITERSFTKAIVIFIPLMLALIFTIGTMGWTGRKLSIATVGLGAMILGLGVEYGVFMFTRYNEEREKGKGQLGALKVAVPAVGAAITGSGMTTIIGFLALTLSILPMLQNLGISLAMGIAYCLVATILFAPVIFLVEEDLEHWLTHRNHKRITKKIEKHKRIGK